jgi:hypothetical protein
MLYPAHTSLPPLTPASSRSGTTYASSAFVEKRQVDADSYKQEKSSISGSLTPRTPDSNTHGTGLIGEDPYAGDHTKENARLLRRFDVRILPLSAGIYLLCYLDRSNIGNARVMNGWSLF